MTKPLTAKQQNDLDERTRDMLKTLVPRVESYVVVHAEREDIERVRAMHRRLASFVKDFHPDPIMEWEVEDE